MILSSTKATRNTDFRHKFFTRKNSEERKKRRRKKGGCVKVDFIRITEKLILFLSIKSF